VSARGSHALFEDLKPPEWVGGALEHRSPRRRSGPAGAGGRETGAYGTTRGTGEAVARRGSAGTAGAAPGSRSATRSAASSSAAPGRSRSAAARRGEKPARAAVSDARAGLAALTAPTMGRLLLVSAVALLLFGLVMAYSASTYQAYFSYGSSWYFLKKQLLFAGIGLVVMFVLSRTDYRLLRKLALPAALGVAGLLVLVALPGVGTTINGARRWIDVFGTSLQPSELAKPVTVLLLAALLAARPAFLKSFKGFLIVTAVAFLPMAGLILVGKDLSTTVVLALGVCAVLIVAGVRWGHLLTAGAFAAGVFGILIMTAPWRMARFTAFLDPWAHADTSGFQATQSLISVASGHVFGVGLGNSVQKSGFLPEQTTDMITGVIGEELGLVGILILVFLYGMLAWAGMRLATTCREPFARYVCTGLTMMVVGQALLNLGAAMGMLPIMGVPLPLVSCGGTSLLAVLAGVGIMLNIANNRRSHIVVSPERRRRAGGGRGDRRPHGAGVGGR